MKFNKETITPMPVFLNHALMSSYNGDIRLITKIGSTCRKENSIILYALCTLSIQTIDNQILKEYKYTYICEVEIDHQSEIDDKIDIWEYFKKCLISTSNIVGYGDTIHENDNLKEVSWQDTIDKAYNRIIGCV